MTGEDAIRRIKTRFDKWALDDEDMKAIKTLIPELAENKDEKIRQSIIKDIEWDINYNITTAGKVVEKYNEQINWLKALPLSLKKRNEDVAKLCSNEWSEEDENKLNHILEIVHIASGSEASVNEKEELESFLKSLRPQPRVKTNDYITPHKEFFEWIYNRLINVHNENPNVDYMQSFRKRIDNLQFDEPQWKPSEEQIGALNYAYCELFKREDVGHNILGPLQELLDNLKKRM